MSRVLALVAELGAAPAIAARAGPLSPSSQARIARLNAPRRRAQSALARQLAALAASRLLGRELPASCVGEAGDGRGPWLGDAEPLRVSVAHSHERVAVAVGAGPVGIDVERCDRQRDWLAFARHAYSDAEVAWLDASAPGERAARFYLLWTLREASFKAGLRAAVQGGEPCLGPHANGASFGWSSRELDGYRVSVATPAPAPIEWLAVAGEELVPLALPREAAGGATAPG
ncbi:MAG TPA: 4'-phosphopantetheinyl transferase superfamily protein [Steroidobacteraceae bacterium]|nr:4'-phosphopantetheinyl transferase superfamily protein [Steroidobacteraceae bacterium]